MILMVARALMRDNETKVKNLLRKNLIFAAPTDLFRSRPPTLETPAAMVPRKFSANPDL